MKLNEVVYFADWFGRLDSKSELPYLALDSLVFDLLGLVLLSHELQLELCVEPVHFSLSQRQCLRTRNEDFNQLDPELIVVGILFEDLRRELKKLSCLSALQVKTSELLHEFQFSWPKSFFEDRLQETDLKICIIALNCTL